MSARFVNVDRRTPMLLPPDLREWIEEDDPVHFIIEAVERLPLTSFRVNHRGTGEKQFPAHMMMALLVYCYVQGIFSSQKNAKHTKKKGTSGNLVGSEGEVGRTGRRTQQRWSALEESCPQGSAARMGPEDARRSGGFLWTTFRSPNPPGRPVSARFPES